MDHWPKSKTENLKNTRKYNIWENLYNLGLNKDFLNMTPKALLLKE